MAAQSRFQKAKKRDLKYSKVVLLIELDWGAPITIFKILYLRYLKETGFLKFAYFIVLCCEGLYTSQDTLMLYSTCN